MSPAPVITALTTAGTSPTMTMTMTGTGAGPADADTAACQPEPYLDQLAHLVADHGVQAFEGDIARFVVRLRAAGNRSPHLSALSSPLIGILADRSVASVARERAFGRLLCILLDSTTRHPVKKAAAEESCAREAA